VKNDERDAADLADLLRMGRRATGTRELRQLVRHRAKLVGLRSNLRCQVHAVLAGAGVQVVMSDLFGAQGQQLLCRVALAPAARAPVNSVLRLIENLDFEIELFAKLVAGRLREHPGYTAIQVIPGVGPVLAAVFVAETGDIARFDTPAQLASWAGLTPKHHESDTTVHRGRITKQGWTAGLYEQISMSFGNSFRSSRPTAITPASIVSWAPVALQRISGTVKDARLSRMWSQSRCRSLDRSPKFETNCAAMKRPSLPFLPASGGNVEVPVWVRSSSAFISA